MLAASNKTIWEYKAGIVYWRIKIRFIYRTNTYPLSTLTTFGAAISTSLSAKATRSILAEMRLCSEPILCK